MSGSRPTRQPRQSATQRRAPTQESQQSNDTSAPPKRAPGEFATRFLRVFGSHVFGSCKQANLPDKPRGIMFFSTEASKYDDKGVPYRYRSAHLGQSVLLTPEQERHIIEYLGLSTDPFGQRK